ncbi:hypothetical protein [Ferruginibacter sp.]
MNTIKPIIFLLPVIALALTSILYFILLKKSTYKKYLRQYVFITAAIAFLLNFAWELIQLPLYKNSVYDIDHIAFCALATLADVIMVLLLYFGLALIFKNPFWIQQLNEQRITLVILMGGIGAVLSEMRHLKLASWVYAASMPLIPLVKAGVTPVLQFMLLPLLSYLLSIYFLKKLHSKKTIQIF